jgi:hypothetical protein
VTEAPPYEPLNGADAPVPWAEGKREEVLRCVGQDARTSMDLAVACESRKELRWIARSGKVRSLAIPEGWLTVEEAQKLPLPNTSWMGMSHVWVLTVDSAEASRTCRSDPGNEPRQKSVVRFPEFRK